MQLDLSGHHVEVTQALRTYVFKKFERISRHFEQLIDVHCVLTVEKMSHKAEATLMVRGVASALEKHHRVQLLDEALEAAVRLSHRYIPARQLPDKAVSLLDTVCARLRGDECAELDRRAISEEVDFPRTAAFGGE